MPSQHRQLVYCEKGSSHINPPIVYSAPPERGPCCVGTWRKLTLGGRDVEASLCCLSETGVSRAQPQMPWCRACSRPSKNDIISANQLKVVVSEQTTSTDNSSPNVSYLSDVEGNWEYFVSFVALTEAMTMNGNLEDGTADITMHDGWHFVFGGDSVDKGGEVGGSIRVVRSLLRLKNKYPARVTLILGNRDINKIRMTSELHEDELSAWSEVPGPPWVPPTKRISPRQHLQALVSAMRRVPMEEVTDEMLAEANSLETRICWMLKETMGSDGEFDRRQRELTEIAGQEASASETARSFVES